ncbi:MAG: carboxylesterase family protein [Alphaproteobacteria bacterium]|nr:carboxylesterase family protein [Alphaproteobacteria bacterium]
MAAAVLALTLPSARAATVQTDAGRVRGVEEDGLSIFKAIPFAAPPVGPLRWHAPDPVKPWPGVRDATAFAPACMQEGVSMPGEAPPMVSEDCLYLNVWAPAHAKKLPVMVWIYGGGYSNGSASMPLYWGDRLARRDIVVVTIAYRVGPFGFLALPELSRESAHGSSGNYALLDEVAALKWVQKNIENFGGDPNKVTIAGQSAGAMSVSMLLASPLAKGLFARAIGQSGGLFEPTALAPGYQLANAEKDGEAYAASVGAASLAELRKLPAAQLLKGKAGLITHPVIEPYVLPQSPYDAFVSGAAADVPMLIGSNADEARSLVSGLGDVTAATYDAEIAKHWGPLPPPLLEAYPYSSDAEAKTSRLAFERDLRFGWDMWAWARLGAAENKSAVYYYHFTQNPPFPNDSIYAHWGPSHFAELWYMFDHLDQAPWRWTAADRKLADTMASYWVNFVRSGNPNGAGLPQWPAFTGTDQRVQYLGDPVSTGTVANRPPLEVFDGVYSAVRGASFGESKNP